MPSRTPRRPTYTATRLIFFVAVSLLVVAFSLYMHNRLRFRLEPADLKEEMDRLDEEGADGSVAP